MVRFVIAPDQTVVVDLAERLPGRGLWVSADRRALETALAKNCFSRAAKQQVVLSPELVDHVSHQLRQRCLHWLGLARGAGALLLGQYQVENALAQGEAGLLVEAADGSENGRSKLLSHSGGLPVVACFTRAELGEAVGRSQAVHLALRPGSICDRFLADARRYMGISGLDHPQQGGER
jgi:uncharacterized protein